MNAVPRKILQSDVESVNRQTGTLFFRFDKATPVVPSDVVAFKGIGFTVAAIEQRDDGQLVARAEVVQIEELGAVQPFALTLAPGDVIVLTSQVPLPDAGIQAIVDRAKTFFPGYKVIVLDAGLTVGKITVPTSGA